MNYQAKKYELSCRNCLGYHSEKKELTKLTKLVVIMPTYLNLSGGYIVYYKLSGSSCISHQDEVKIWLLKKAVRVNHSDTSRPIVLTYYNLSASSCISYQVERKVKVFEADQVKLPLMV